MRISILIPAICLTMAACSPKVQSQLLNDVKELSSDKYKGRKTGTEENKMAADYVIKRFRELGLKSYAPDYKHPFSFKTRAGADVNGSNLLAYIPGKSSEVFVISAHYDHVGVTNGEIFNGADDNASGVGGLLYVASYYAKHKPEHTLIFAAFDAEEMGLQGARAFVANPPVPVASIKLNVNMDMISHNDKGELYAAGSFHYPELKQYLYTTNTKIKLLIGHDDPKLGHDDWTGQSDQGAFHQKKIPFIYFGVEDHPDYHKPTDDFERINKEFYVEAAGVVREVIEHADKGKSLQQQMKDKQIMN
jgi:hypothetical protein